MKNTAARAVKIAAVAIIAVGIFSLAVFAQTVSGTLRGMVTDSNGAAVPNATVTARSTETGLERTVTSSGEGVYNFAFLPIGRYKLEATRTDFNKVIQDDVLVSLNETNVVNLRLDPTVTGEVTVTDDAATINTSDAQVTQSLSASQILERPVANQGNFLTLAETFTGFQENPTSGQNNPTLSSGSSINFNGTGTRGATFQINGVNNDDSSENQNRQGASLATIKAFQVITNNFSAEFGRGYGAVVLAQTENGRNKPFGSAYLYHNDSALNAKSYFAHGAKPVNRRNQYGGVFGFPLLKDKLLGFVSFDQTRNTGALNYTRDVFLPSERNPANWFLTTPANDTPANRAFIQSVIDRFPADLIPNDSRSPRTFAGQRGFDFPAEDYSGRLDWNASSKDTVYARWQYTRQKFTAEDIIHGERADQNNKQQNIGLTWTHNFSSNLVGEFRYGLGLRTTLVNIAAGNDTPIIRFQSLPVSIAPSTIGDAGAFPIQRYQTDNQYVYNISAFYGDHIVKAGTDLRFQKLDDLADNFSRGFYQFNATCTTAGGVNYSNGFQAMLNGCVANFQKGYGPFFLENRIGESNFYIEDSWKIFSNLTLNLGARYEYVNAPRERQGKIEYGFGDDKDNVEPRFGFAYAPDFEDGWLNTLFGTSGQSSIRAGYGIFHGRLFQSVFSQSGATVRFNPPNAFFYNQTVRSSVFNPNNLQDPTNGFVFIPGPQSTRHSIAIVDPGLEMPYTQQWNFTFERQLPWSSSLRISYTGNRGIGLLKLLQGNIPIHNPAGVFVADHPNNLAALRGQTITPAANLFCAGTGSPGVPITAQCPVAVPIGPLEYSQRIPRTNERRPDPRYSGNTIISNGVWSYYHGLQLELSKRLSSGLNFQAAYTWSKSIDTTSEASFLGAGDSNQLGNDASVSRGLSRFHTPHRFTFFGTYRFPFFNRRKDVVGQVLGGWEVTGVFKWVHGSPFTISGTGFDLNLDGFSEIRPVLVDPSVLGNNVSNPATSQQNLPVSAFRIPTSADLYNCCILGRNTFYLDGVKNVDIGITKRFWLPWEGHTVALRADLFNAFNHVQYGFPNTTYTTTVGGQIVLNPLLGVLNTTATQYAPRTIQVSVKYSF